MSTCAAFWPTSVDSVCVIGIQSCVSPPPLASLLTHTPVISDRWRWLFDFTCPGCTPERTHLFLRPKGLFLHFPLSPELLRKSGWEKKVCVKADEKGDNGSKRLAKREERCKGGRRWSDLPFVSPNFGAPRLCNFLKAHAVFLYNAPG